MFPCTVLLSLSLLVSPSVSRWERALEKTSENYCIDPNLMAAQMWTESKGQPDVVGRYGEIGLFQIMPFDWRPDKEWLFVPANNVDYAGRIMRQLYKRTGSYRESLALFNCGEVRLYAGTCGKGRGWDYADKILRLYNLWKGFLKNPFWML